MQPTLRVQNSVEGHTWVIFIFHKFLRLILNSLFRQLGCFSLQEFSQPFCLHSYINVKVKKYFCYRILQDGSKKLGGKRSFFFIPILLNAVSFNANLLQIQITYTYFQRGRGSATSVLIHKCRTIWVFTWLSLYSVVRSVMKNLLALTVFLLRQCTIIIKKMKPGLYQLYETGLKM